MLDVHKCKDIRMKRHLFVRRRQESKRRTTTTNSRSYDSSRTQLDENKAVTGVIACDSGVHFAFKKKTWVSTSLESTVDASHINSFSFQRRQQFRDIKGKEDENVFLGRIFSDWLVFATTKTSKAGWLTKVYVLDSAFLDKHWRWKVSWASILTMLKTCLDY